MKHCLTRGWASPLAEAVIAMISGQECKLLSTSTSLIMYDRYCCPYVQLLLARLIMNQGRG